jgi:hypothetical protein
MTERLQFKLGNGSILLKNTCECKDAILELMYPSNESNFDWHSMLNFLIMPVYEGNIIEF